MKNLNPFELFHLKPSPNLVSLQDKLLSPKAIKAMYVRMQAACHPDSFALANTVDQQAAAAKSAQLAEAYKVLSDDLARVKSWLSLQGVDIESQTVQPDMSAFELQMRLNDELDQLDGTNLDAQQRFTTELKAIRSEVMDWFQAQTAQDVSTDFNRCLNQFGRLAMVTRLSQKVKDLSF